jgi:hypothetical protein
VSLTGTGFNPVTRNPTSLTFGTPTSPIARGTTSAFQTVTLTNPNGNPMLGIGTPTFPTYFSRNGGSCALVLAGGSSCTINVVFSPTSGDTTTNPNTGTMTINTTFNAVTVTLTGYHN